MSDEEESQEVKLLRSHFTCVNNRKQRMIDNLTESLKQRASRIDTLEGFIKHTAEIEESKKYVRALFWVLSLALVWYVS